MKLLVHNRLAAGFALAATVALAAGVLSPWSNLNLAHAQSGAAAAPAQTCSPRTGQLGVSRIVEIDTTRGARFGLMQYPEHDFLRENEVVLTFDDGPLRKHTRMVLEALAAHCTKATFFMVGQMAIADPEMAREVANAGHTVAIHTWSHRNLRASGAAAAQREIELGISAVSRAIGQPVVAPFFRFPYLADSQAMLAHLGERNFGTFSIDVDSKDFRTHNPKEMQRVVMGGVIARKKGILLFHDIQFSTAHGIRAVLDDLAARGLKVVHIVPKTPAATVASYDALADAELATRHKVVAGNPMAARSVVWPIAQTGVPVDQLKPSAASTNAAAMPPRASTRPAAIPASAPAAAAPQPQPAVAQPQASQPSPQPAPAAATAEDRPRLRGSSDDDDWRKRVFGQ